jgi:hypothetical protein
MHSKTYTPPKAQGPCSGELPPWSSVPVSCVCPGIMLSFVGPSHAVHFLTYEEVMKHVKPYLIRRHASGDANMSQWSSLSIAFLSGSIAGGSAAVTSEVIMTPFDGAQLPDIESD